MLNENRDDSPPSDGESVNNEINVSDSFYTDGRLDKEKFYAYLKKKPKGIQGISDETEATVLKDAEKHRWNYKEI